MNKPKSLRSEVINPNKVFAQLSESKTTELDEVRKQLKLLEAMLNQIAKKIDGRIEKVEDRLDGVEDQLEDRISPPVTKITPALEETLVAIEELTDAHSPAQWVTIPEISERTKRSVPTEESYAKFLHDNGILVRRALYTRSRQGRRVRRYGYKPKPKCAPKH